MKKALNALWQFCSYLFVPQCDKFTKDGETKEYLIKEFFVLVLRYS